MWRKHCNRDSRVSSFQVGKGSPPSLLPKLKHVNVKKEEERQSKNPCLNASSVISLSLSLCAHGKEEDGQGGGREE